MQEGARGGCHRHTTQRDGDRPKLGRDLLRAIAARPGDSRESLRRREAREQRAPRRIQSAIGAEQQIRPAIQQVQHRRAIALQRRQAWQQIAQRLQHRDQARMQHRAGSDIQNGRTARRVKAKPEPIRPAPDGEISAPARARGRGDGLGNGGFGKTATCQGNTQLVALPGGLRRRRPMLQRAAAAAFRKMRASRRDAIKTWV
ncbi:MAG: hypothetical protein LW713_17700 [Acetobacteraceae bacterium]|nr:hypothetical protein [Acetobacteraceae bacterium]